MRRPSPLPVFDPVQFDLLSHTEKLKILTAFIEALDQSTGPRSDESQQPSLNQQSSTSTGMDDPIAKLLLPDAEFARLTQDQKFAYIQKVLHALLAEHAATKAATEPEPPADSSS